MVRIATWNVNSVRLRLPIIKRLHDEFSPDILCLQETKVIDNLFPLAELKEIGFEHCYFNGQKSYNGVAILSKIKADNYFKLFLVKNDARHIGIILNDVELYNFYIPSGGDIPDTNLNDKFAHKLDYCTAFTEYFTKNRKKSDKIIVVGDLNIAPHENDVWSHKQLKDVISHTEVEIDFMKEMIKSLDFCDIARKFIPKSEKLYSWWSYRNQDWHKSNRGRRLDHIWTTQTLSDKITKFNILKEARDWTLPSDHVPVIIDLDF